MKTLKRNKRKFYYATYQGNVEILDANGNHTFEKRNTYSEWKEFHANISPARGESSAALFGNDVSYDKTIVTDDLDCEIDENTVLCIDIAPNIPPQPTETTEVTSNVTDKVDPPFEPVYDYIVTKKAVSLNFIQYAVTKVKVNGSTN